MINKKNIFSLMISVVTFLVVSVGATFAYFTASAGSNENAIRAESAVFSVSLAATSLYTNHAIIPTLNSDIITAYENECKDFLGNGACFAWVISILNNGSDMRLANTINFTINGLQNLSYMVLDSDNNTYKDVTLIEEGPIFSLGEDYLLASGESKTFTLLIWLSETGNPQDETDAGGNFSASVSVTSTEGDKLTGSIAGIN